MFIRGDSTEVLSNFADNTFDLLITDPPYGISFMGKDWDKALPSLDIWKECFRVLKEGKLAFIMCSPRQDVLSRMIISLEDAGFRTNYTSIYWTYASGFPKAANVSKLIDKKNGRTQEQYKELADYLKQRRLEANLTMTQLGEHFKTSPDRINHGGCVTNWEAAYNVPTMGQWQILKQQLNLDNRFDELIERTEAEREIVGKDKRSFNYASFDFGREWNITKPATDEAKKMEGAYVGFQPKPAVEIILVISKGKTLTWLDDCRIPYQSEQDKDAGWYSDIGLNKKSHMGKLGWEREVHKDYKQFPENQKGRFPANLLVSDDVLNDGKITKSSAVGFTGPNLPIKKGWNQNSMLNKDNCNYSDSGSYSRYFSLDSWSENKTFPFIITPKASKSEKNKGCEDLPLKEIPHNNNMKCAKCGLLILSGTSQTCKCETKQEIRQKAQNHHPTVKPLKLFSYLITMGSREGDLILDPFIGSGTTYLASVNLHRECIGIELNPEYLQIAKARVKPLLQQTKLKW